VTHELAPGPLAPRVRRKRGDPGHLQAEPGAGRRDVRFGATDLDVELARGFEAAGRRNRQTQEDLAERDEVVHLGRPELDLRGAAEDERHRQQLGTPVGAEGDTGGLALLRPRREVRQVEERRGLARACIGVNLERERHQLGAIEPLGVVRALVVRPLAPDDVGLVPPIRLRGPDAVGVVEDRADGVVHVHPLGHRHDVIGDAQAAHEEGLAAEVVLDSAADPVVPELRARFPALYAEPRVPLERRPAPVLKEPAGLDPVRDAIPLPSDRDVVAAARPVDRLGEHPVQVEGEQAIENSDVRGVCALSSLGGGGGPPSAKPADRGQEEGQGQSQELATGDLARGDQVPGHVRPVRLF